MKGLLLKDFYQMMKYCKMFFVIDLVFLVTGFFLDDISVFIIFPVVLCALLPITLLSLDERCGWTDYSGILPYTYRQIVSAKYVFGLIMQTIFSVIVLVVLIVRGAVHGEPDVLGNAAIVGIMSAVSLIFPAVCLPFCFKFGTEKGRLIYFLLIAVMLPLLSMVVDGNTEGTEYLSYFGNVALIPAIAVIPVYAGSWAVSVPLLKSVKH